MASDFWEANLETWTLPLALTNESSSQLGVDLLIEYFTIRNTGRPDYSGAFFNALSGGGDRAGHSNHIDSFDVIALGLLSTPAKELSALDLLGIPVDRHKSEIEYLLAQVPNVDLHLATNDDLEAADKAWEAILGRFGGIHGIGRTTGSKLLARKRPNLIPILDGQVEKLLGYKSGPFWKTLRWYLNEPSGGYGSLYDRLKEIQAEAVRQSTKHSRNDALRPNSAQSSELISNISIIRVFDVIAWMSQRKLRLNGPDSDV